MDQLQPIINKIQDHRRIDSDEGLIILREMDFLTLASLANRKRYYYHSDKIVTFIIDRNINYTNICISGCRFCAFHKQPGQKHENDGGYVISQDSLFKKIEETIELGGTQILLQGGMNPDLDIAYYVTLLENIKDNFDIHIHGFSPPEIDYIADKSNLSISKTISVLQAAGLSSIPGGGAEILNDEIRRRVSPNKCRAGKWLSVMRQAHLQGMRSSATMMFGHLEQDHHIIEHLEKLRCLQDETKGFTAFIPWTFQPDNTKIKARKRTSVEYLRVLAVSRLYLDNIENIQASWVTQGDKIAQTALFFGANDMGSTMIEENVVASAGVDFMLPKQELTRLIETAGFEPRQRDCHYRLL